MKEILATRYLLAAAVGALLGRVQAAIERTPPVTRGLFRVQSRGVVSDNVGILTLRDLQNGGAVTMAVGVTEKDGETRIVAILGGDKRNADDVRNALHHFGTPVLLSGDPGDLSPKRVLKALQ